MGLQDWVRGLRAPRIMAVPDSVQELQVSKLDTFNVEGLLGIRLAVSDVPELLRAVSLAGSGSSVRLVCAGARPVTFIFSRDSRQVPALDPNEGWLIPVTAANAELIAGRVTGEADSWEIPELGIGIVVEG